MTIYRLKREDILDQWLDTQPPVAVRTRVLNWLFELLEDPLSRAGTPVPNTGLPISTALVPGTGVSVEFTLVKSPPFPPDMAAVVLVSIG